MNLRFTAILCCLALGSSCSEKEQEPPVPAAGDKSNSGRVLALPEPPAPEPYSIEHWPPMDSPARSPWEKRYQSAATDEERMAVISEKAAVGPESLAPLLRLALQSNSRDVKLQAVEAAAGLEAEDAVDILSGAAYDPMEDVAVFATETARGLDEESRLEVYGNLLAAPHVNVRKAVVVELSRERNKPSVDLLIAGLGDEAESVRQSTQNALKMIFNQAFEDPGTASTWWLANQKDYNAKLTRIVE